MRAVAKHAGSALLVISWAAAGLAACGTGDDPWVVVRASRPDAARFTSGTVDTVGSGATGSGGDGGAGGTDDPGTGGSLGKDGGQFDGASGNDGATGREGCSASSGALASFYLSDLDWIGTPVNGLGPVERDTSNGDIMPGDGHPISIAGASYTKGLGVNANSSIEFGLGGNCATFSAYVGADDDVSGASVTFEVWIDGTRAYSSPAVVRTGQPAALVSLDVSCALSLRLVVTDAVVDGNAHDHADWADAKVACTSMPGGPLVDAGQSRDAGVSFDGASSIDSAISKDSASSTDGSIDIAPSTDGPTSTDGGHPADGAID